MGQEDWIICGLLVALSAGTIWWLSGLRPRQ